MATNVYVSVSGPALSFLLYENVRSLSDQVSMNNFVVHVIICTRLGA